MVHGSLIALIVAALQQAPAPVQSTYFPSRGDGVPVVVWGGSSPAPPDGLARELAAAGHPALSVAYFGRPGLPEELERIPLEYFARAIRAFGARPGIDARRIVVWGNSRGSEAALLVGARYPGLVHGVVASAPSSKAYYAVYDPTASAWTFRGREVPYANLEGADPKTEPRSVIEAERIDGPVILGAGTHDQLYDSAGYARAIARRLRRRHFAHPVTVRIYDAGHSVSERLLPTVLSRLRRTARAGPS